MVVIQIKTSNEHDTFLYETTCDTLNDSLVRDLVKVWNLRIRLRQLAGGLRELAEYGPMKHPDKAGIDEIQEKYNNERIEKGEYYKADPTGIRNGNGVGPQLGDTMNRVADDLESILDKEKLDLARGAVMMAFPMGLPEWDTIRLTLEGEAGLQGTAAGQEILNEDTAELWVASRNFDRTNNQTVADRLGRNEKTKVIGKLQKPGGGAPGREPGISEDEKKSMMAYYFKKQEEYKKMSENNEDDYLHSSWADPKQLQRNLRGQNGVRAPGIR
eukprot:scaffold7822_cov179-Ochromonas_danica.AAC.15